MMAVAGSLQFSHNLGICKNHGRTNHFKNMVGRGRLGLLHVALSSHGSQLDALSLHLSDSLHRPIRSVPSRGDVFLCQSFLIPGQSNEIPILKTAATAVTRSYNAFRASPLVIQLLPAVGIIAFAVWGLGPFMRHSRNVFFHRNDNSWKKSSTHYVMTSYLQPLLLWTGAALVCRALDPVVLPSETSQVVKQRLLNFVRSLSTVLAFAYCLSSLIQQAQKFFMETNDSNDTRNMGFQFAGKAVYTAVWVAAVSLFMELLGFSTQKWLTAGGLGTVLLTLAGREIFTNFLSSAMIHATRPFVVNEWIQTKIEGYEVSGTVEHVGWWSPTIIRGEDREAVHIPNHKFTVNVVRNLSQKSHWRIKTHLAISHLDVNKINSIVADMRKVLAKNPQVEQQRLHRRVFLDNINPENQALLILVSCFVKTSHFEEYLCVKETIFLDLLRVISHHRARLATPIRTVQKIYSDADMENIPFSDSIFTRPGAPNDRPFLLIEPSYRINGDDKSKSQARSMRRNEEHDTKVTTKATPESKIDGKVTEKSSDSKAEGKVTATSKADPKVTAASTSDPKVDIKVSATSTSDSKAGPKVIEKSKSESKSSGPVSDGMVQDVFDNKQPKKTNSGDSQQKKTSGDAQKKSNKIDSVPTTAAASTPPKSQLEGRDSTRLNPKDVTLLGAAFEEPQVNSSEPGSIKTEDLPKQENERLPVTPPPNARPALEENIVLGVALEGSKRTLPIEEGMPPSPAPVEAKELAGSRNGNASHSAGKDKKGSQIPYAPGAVSGEQRDKER